MRAGKPGPPSVWGPNVDRIALLGGSTVAGWARRTESRQHRAVLTDAVGNRREGGSRGGPDGHIETGADTEGPGGGVSLSVRPWRSIEQPPHCSPLGKAADGFGLGA